MGNDALSSRLVDQVFGRLPGAAKASRPMAPADSRILDQIFAQPPSEPLAGVMPALGGSGVAAPADALAGHGRPLARAKEAASAVWKSTAADVAAPVLLLATILGGWEMVLEESGVKRQGPGTTRYELAKARTRGLHL